MTILIEMHQLREQNNHIEIGKQNIEHILSISVYVQ